MLLSLLQTLFYLVSISHPPARLLLRPQSLRLAWTETPGQISVLWTSWLPLPSPKVMFTVAACGGRSEEAQWSEGATTSKVFAKSQAVDLFVQIVYSGLISGVESDCDYRYTVGQSPHLWSKSFEFHGVTPYSDASATANRTATLAVFGDMGIGNFSQFSRKHLRELAESKTIDGIIHLGDIAYDMYRHMGGVSDQFFREIEPIAARVPYMVAPGNHEHHMNFSHYKGLFRMPGNEANEGSSLFYSFNLGRAHFVALNGEAYFYLSKESVQVQYRWLLRDFEQAALQREDVPWLILYLHKPLYCNIDWRRPMEESDDFKCNYNCGHECSLLRGELEDLFYANGVDLVLAGHLHNYERDAPIFHNCTVPSEIDEPHYHKNARAQVSILSGAAGSDHMHDALSATPQLWNRAYCANFGIGVLTIFNKTHVGWEEYDSETREVVDWLVLEKTQTRYDSTLQ